MRGLHHGYGAGNESSEKTLIYGGNSLVTTGTRKAEVLGVFFVCLHKVFAQAPALLSLLGKERDGGQ